MDMLNENYVEMKQYKWQVDWEISQPIRLTVVEMGVIVHNKVTQVRH